ncbi:MAG: WD40 repeat domain-containing protein [Gemmataceae bacterium]|nr:WD40 repeat domain-containing protein [Gemmataceae bacterium]
MSSLRILSLGVLMIASSLQAAEPKLDSYGDPLPAGARFRLGTVRFRHGTTSHVPVLSPDGRLLAGRGSDQTIRVWELASGKELCLLSLPFNGDSPEVAFSPDGKLLAAANGGPAVFVWDIPDGKERTPFKGLPFHAVKVRFSPDGRTLAAVASKGSVHLLDVASGKEQVECPFPYGHDFGATGVRIRDLLRMICKPFELDVPDFTKDLPVTVHSCAFGSDGRSVAVVFYAAPSQNMLVCRWETDGGTVQRIWYGPRGQSFEAVFSSDGQKLVVAKQVSNGRIEVWDVGAGKEQSSFTGPRNYVESLAFSADGKKLITASPTEIVEWDAGAGKELARFRERAPRDFDPQVAIAVTPDGRWLVEHDGFDGIRLWDLKTHKQHQPIGKEAPRLWSIALSPDSRTLASVGSEPRIRLWHTATGAERTPLSEEEQTVARPNVVAFSPDGRHLAEGRDDGQLRLWNVETGKSVWQAGQRSDDYISYLAFAPDGKSLAVSDSDGRLRLWRVDTRKQVQEHTIGRHETKTEQATAVATQSPQAAFTADGRMLIGLGERARQEDANKLYFWETATGKERNCLLFKNGHFAGNPDVVRWCAPSPDGRYLALAAGTQIHLCDWLATKELRRFGGHAVSYHGVCFSPDGGLLAAGCSDGTFRLWRVDTGAPLGVFGGHRYDVGVVFSADGKTLVTTGSEGNALLWDIEQLLARPRPLELDADRLQALWTDLGSRDTLIACQAYRTLAAAPETVALLTERCRPIDAKRLPGLLADLSSGKQELWWKAAVELPNFGDVAGEAIRQKLEKPAEAMLPLTDEMRQRWQWCADNVSGLVVHPEVLRSLRAVEVLEQIGTPQAVKLLEALAKGAAKTPLTAAAVEALARLARRAPAKP